MFYEDARRAINEVFYKEVIYADDLNAFRSFAAGVPNETLFASLAMCQEELHS